MKITHNIHMTFFRNVTYNTIFVIIAHLKIKLIIANVSYSIGQIVKQFQQKLPQR